MYRNATYNPSEKCINLFTWDAQGNRVRETHSYHPYVYVETSSNHEKVSIYNTKVRKKTFKSQFERSAFVKSGKIERIYENLQPVQQFLIDYYWQQNETPEFTKQPLRTWFWDIETFSDGGFPDVNNPTDAINLITIYDSDLEKFYTWGTGKIDRRKVKGFDNLVYEPCNTESEILEKFLCFVEEREPDIIAGWNSNLFDTPYVVGRIAKVLSERDVQRLSPVRNVYKRTMRGDFGKIQERWFFDGISSLDYLDIYKRFCLKMRPSYRLNAVAQIELGEGKVDYGSTNLSTLADEDWNKFVEYNIQDVNLLVQMEAKLKYLDLLRMLAYSGLCSFEAAMGSISSITGAAAIRARHHNKVIPTFAKVSDGKIPGAFVAEPQRGFQKDIVSFDATSLYPSILMSLNLSPETKVGWLHQEDDKYVVKLVSGRSYTATKEQFDKFVEKEQIAITKANVLFTQKHEGIMTEVTKRFFDERAVIKTKLFKLKTAIKRFEKGTKEHRKIQFEIDRLNARQLTIKVQINAIYGHFANKHAPLGDKDIAKSITLTGQSIIKQSRVFSDEYIKQNGNGSVLSSSSIYSDTDSVYISITNLLDSPISNNGVIEPTTFNVIDKLSDYINDQINTWAKEELRALNPRFTFKRETICDIGLFLEKKRYILHVLDDEGVSCDKMKYTGVEVVRTTMPDAIKPYAKKIVEEMIYTQSKSKTDKLFYEAYDKFRSLPVEDVSFVKGMSDYDKWVSSASNFTTPKGTPIHVKSAYYYNRLLEMENIEDKYEKLYGGEKVHFFYLEKPNKFNFDTIAYKYYYPEEFKQYFKIDYEVMFEKILFSFVDRLYNAVGWKLTPPAKRVKVTALDLLS